MLHLDEEVVRKMLSQTQLTNQHHDIQARSEPGECQRICLRAPIDPTSSRTSPTWTAITRVNQLDDRRKCHHRSLQERHGLTQRTVANGALMLAWTTPTAEHSQRAFGSFHGGSLQDGGHSFSRFPQFTTLVQRPFCPDVFFSPFEHGKALGRLTGVVYRWRGRCYACRDASSQQAPHGSFWRQRCCLPRMHRPEKRSKQRLWAGLLAG